MNVLEMLEQRRKALKMSRSALAKRSGVSLPTVNRILLKQSDSASFNNVLALSKVLGVQLTGESDTEPESFRHQQARKKAQRIMRLVQGTSALEGQGLDENEFEAMISKTTDEFLASNKKLWD